MHQSVPISIIGVPFDRRYSVVGVVYAPYLRELFYAVKGEGAFMKCGDGEAVRVAVSEKQSLDCSVVGTGFPYDKAVNPDNNSANVARVLPCVRDLRRMGSAAYDLCAVASGMLDGYWEMSLNLWDVCAGNLIVEEAGGVVYGYREDRKISIVAGNSGIVERLKSFVR